MDQELRSFEWGQIPHLFADFLQQAASALPLSARVDILLFLLGVKQVVRTRPCNESIDLQSLQAWAKRNDLQMIIDQEKFVYISIDPELARQVSMIDRSLEPHEESLGLLLGYPPCCSAHIAKVGETNIDAYEDWLIKQVFGGDFQLINTVNYRLGHAFISHVPCSTSCVASLVQARILKDFISTFQHDPIFSPWVTSDR